VEKQAEWRRGEGGKAELSLTISRPQETDADLGVSLKVNSTRLKLFDVFPETYLERGIARPFHLRVPTFAPCALTL